jgi:hypothetical protein
MTWNVLWKYPTFHIQGTRWFGCLTHSNRRQILFTVIGESLVFIILFLLACLLLLVEVMRGENLGLLPNLVFFLITVESSLGTLFCLVLFNHRELFVSISTRIVKLESQLSNGK